MMDVRRWNVPVWPSAPASKSCLYDSSFLFEGNHWPLKEAKCRLLGCLLGHDGPQASEESEDGWVFFSLSPVTSYLYQALKSWAEGRSAKQAQNNGFKAVRWGRPQWWQFAVQRADTPIQINPSINSESILVGILYKGWFFQMCFTRAGPGSARRVYGYSPNSSPNRI